MSDANNINLPPAKPVGLTASLVSERRDTFSPNFVTPQPTGIPNSCLVFPPPPIDFNDPLAQQQFVVTNLQQLKIALNPIAPVTNISGEFDDMKQYRLEFAPEATPEQIAAAHTFLENWPLVREQRRLAKHNYDLVDIWFKEQIAAGFTTSRGFRLGLTTDDVALLTGNFVLAKSGAELGLPVPPIIDMDGVPHTFLSIDDLTFLMLEYGQHRANLSAAYALRKETVRADLHKFNIDVAA